MNKIQETTGKVFGAGSRALSEDVPVGYKLTEVGMIPEEWKVDRIDQHTSIKTGSKNTQDKQEDGDYPFFVRSQEVERIGSYSYDGEAVLTAGDGVGTGKVFHYIQGRFDVHQRVYRITDFSDWLNGRYFFYQFSAEFYNRIMSMTAKSSVDSVRLEMIAGMQIPLPPPIEQRVIAEALSDVDGLLGALEELISKKRAVKQATMQQLLTGKTRLPGFSGEWETKQLRDIAELHRQNVVPAIFGNMLFMHFSLPAYDEDRYPVIELGSRIGSNKFQVPDNAVLVSKLNPRIPRVWAPTSIGSNAVASTEFMVLTPRESISRSFLYILCSSPGFCEQMELLATGTTGSHQRISPPEVMKINVWLPMDSDEQDAIATVLSDMDAEIAALERRRDKARVIKQGMMQQLLTGRVRLVKPKTSTEESEVASPSGRKHNWQFNEAVVISVLAKHFGNEQYPLGRMRYTKLSYLLHRHEDGHTEGYLKKAAGPYNPHTRYGGPEKIALQKDYVRQHRSGKGQGFVASTNVDEAEVYFDRWYGSELLQWLEQFRYKKNNDLELLTTVDMAVAELYEAEEKISVENVKKVIRSHPEWEPKLDRPIFSDASLARAIESCQKLFDY